MATREPVPAGEPGASSGDQLEPSTRQVVNFVVLLRRLLLVDLVYAVCSGLGSASVLNALSGLAAHPKNVWMATVPAFLWSSFLGFWMGAGWICFGLVWAGLAYWAASALKIPTNILRAVAKALLVLNLIIATISAITSHAVLAIGADIVNYHGQGRTTMLIAATFVNFVHAFIIAWAAEVVIIGGSGVVLIAVVAIFGGGMKRPRSAATVAATAEEPPTEPGPPAAGRE